MKPRDPLESFEQALFSAARRERTQTGALERTADALVASHRRRRAQRVGLVFGGAVALVAGLALLLRSSPNAGSIAAEQIVPRHSVSSVAVRPSASTTPSSAASANPALLRSGLTTTTIEEELEMLNGARAALASGQPEAALALLDKYDQVSGGHLTGSATLLRIQALSNSGRVALASSLAQRFIDSDPNGPLAEQARAFLVKAP